MASERLNLVVFFTVMAIAGIQMQSIDAKKTHYVGGSTGWIIPSSPNSYTTWAASQTFKLGDTLVFNFTTGAHTAAQVTKAAYDACTTTNTIATWTTGPSRVKLNTTGPHYYICTVPSHCNPLGQKVAITVVSAAATPSASTPSPTPTEAPAPGSSSTPSASTPGSSSSTPSAQAPGSSSSTPSASFIATALPLTFLSVSIMALFY